MRTHLVPSLFGSFFQLQICCDPTFSSGTGRPPVVGTPPHLLKWKKSDHPGNTNDINIFTRRGYNPREVRKLDSPAFYGSQLIQRRDGIWGEEKRIITKAGAITKGPVHEKDHPHSSSALLTLSQMSSPEHCQTGWGGCCLQPIIYKITGIIVHRSIYTHVIITTHSVCWLETRYLYTELEHSMYSTLPWGLIGRVPSLAYSQGIRSWY